MNRNRYNIINLVKSKLRIFVNYFFIIYIVYLAYLTLFSSYYGRGYFHRSLNLIPFKTMVEYLHSTYNPNIIFTNLLGNIAAFIPMGLLSPLVFKSIDNVKRVTFIVLLSTLAVEILQYILGVGTADIDDIILNTLGGVIGFGLYRLFKDK